MPGDALRATQRRMHLSKGCGRRSYEADAVEPPELLLACVDILALSKEPVRQLTPTRAPRPRTVPRRGRGADPSATARAPCARPRAPVSERRTRVAGAVRGSGASSGRGASISGPGATPGTGRASRSVAAGPSSCPRRGPGPVWFRPILQCEVYNFRIAHVLDVIR